MKEKGQIFVITAPSGTGKTTIIKNILEKDAGGIGYSISHTTRKPRKGESHGLHYYFVDRENFERMIEAHEFVEWAVVYDHLYGTSISSINRELSSGKDLLMDVDIQGSQEIKRQFPDSLSIFILPPSLNVLKERLQKRSPNNKMNMGLRLKKAGEEIQRCRDYDFIIINDDLKKAIKEIEAIIVAQRANKNRRFPLIQKIFHM
ncbi:MAG: guanylate kinase [Deltaproteobacteria bacterium]|nr:guanylate kinase [Deltaproteobacteria bacterium]